MIVPWASAHEARPAYLEINETETDTFAITWKVPAKGPDQRLALDVIFPADCEVLQPPSRRYIPGAFLEYVVIRRHGGLIGQVIQIEGLERTQTDALIRYSSQDGITQAVRADPSSPTFVLAANPTTWSVCATYLVLGIEHILGGIDHLLFVLALLILVKGTRRLIATVTAFTIAHSLTLAGATLGFVHVPLPPVEAVIALSIVFVAT